MPQGSARNYEESRRESHVKHVETHNRLTRTHRILAVAFVVLAILGLGALAYGAIDISDPATGSWMPANPPWDPPNDQRTGSGSVSQDVVGDATHPSAFIQFSPDGSEIGVRIRVNGADGNLSFKNFAYIGLDVNGDGAIDFYLGAYNPTANGRIAVYLSDPALANTGPGNSGVTKPIAAFQPRVGINYSFIQVPYDTADPRYPGFNNDPDYFISFKFTLSDINAALVASGKTNLTLTPSTPFTYVIGTATQDNSLNGDVNGLDGLSDGQTWPLTYSPISTDGTEYYVVHFNGNGADREADPLSMSIKGGERIPHLPTPPLRRGGYSFVGWSYNQLALDAPLTNAFNPNTPITADITVYAVWKTDATETPLEEDIVHFDPSGGSWAGNVTFQHVMSSDGIIRNMPIAPTPPTSPSPKGKSAWIFGGWVVDSRVYNVTGSNNIVEFSGNVNLTNPNVDYFTWSTLVSDLTKKYQAHSGQDEYTAYAIWIWADPASPQLSFYDNIFDNDPLTITPPAPGTLLYKGFVSNNSAPAITPVPLTRQGFVFRGWDTNPNADPSSLTTGTRFLDPYNTATTNAVWQAQKFTTSTSFYAMWEPASYGTLFNPNTIDTNGDNLSASSVLTMDYREKLNPLTTGGFVYPAFPNVSRTGYTFMGWNTDPEGFGFWGYPTYDPSRLISAGGDMKFTLLTTTTPQAPMTIEGQLVSGYLRLYAIWERQPAPPVQVTFDAMGGRFDDGVFDGIGQQDYWTTHDGRIDSSGYSIPTKLYTDGSNLYVFLGWSYSGAPDRQVDFIHPSTEVFNQSTTVYAVWSDPVIHHNVTFWPNTGEWPGAANFNEDPYAPITVETNDFGVVTFVPYSSNPVGPVRSGFIFTGWNTEPDGSGAVFRPDLPVDHDLVVFAQW